MPILPRVHAGRRDLERAADALASRLPEPLGVFARLAYNYRWSWAFDGADVFRAIDPERWERVAENPVRLLQATSADRLSGTASDSALPLREEGRADPLPAAASDSALLERAAALEREVLSDLARPPRPGLATL